MDGPMGGEGKNVWGRGVKSCEEGFGRRRVRSERKRGLGETGVEG
jgi:hypothetical protein